jgi:teichuronic acid biosynthesis glycosyltransferase TuaC
MRRRVLFITSLFPNESAPHLATFNVKIVKALKEHVDCTVLAPVRWLPRLWVKAGAEPQEPETKQHFREMMNGLHVVRPKIILPPILGRSLHWLFYAAFVYRKTAQLLARHHFDCIYSMYAYPDGAASVLLGRFLRRPVVVHVMGCDINYLTEFLVRRKVIQWSLRHAIHVVSVSRAMKEKLIALDVPSSRISVIYNGVDTSVFAPKDMVVCRRRLGIKADEKAILFVGTFEKVKGVEDLVKAFEALVKDWDGGNAELRLYMIGSGSLEGSIARMVRSADLDSRVRLIGNVRNERIADWMNACDVFCLPSIREGLPNVLLEAMACCRPIVATRVGGIPELIEDYALGVLVEPDDQEGLRQALANTVEITSEVNCAGVATTYGWARFGSQAAEILEQIVR